MVDQKEVVVYVCRRSWRCWLTRRLLERRGYRFEVIETRPQTPSCARGWSTSRAARRCPTSSSTTDRLVASSGWLANRAGIFIIQALSLSLSTQRPVQEEVPAL